MEASVAAQPRCLLVALAALIRRAGLRASVAAVDAKRFMGHASQLLVGNGIVVTLNCKLLTSCHLAEYGLAISQPAPDLRQLVSLQGRCDESYQVLCCIVYVALSCSASI